MPGFCGAHACSFIIHPRLFDKLAVNILRFAGTLYVMQREDLKMRKVFKMSPNGQDDGLLNGTRYESCRFRLCQVPGGFFF